MDKKYCILYVDDEASNLKTFKATFKWDFQILLAQSAQEAIDILNEQEIHLIIADQRMPNMTGFEFFKSIIESHPEPIRMILTGYSDLNILIRAINECGIYQYLTKPWSEEELRYAINKGLEVFQLRQDNKTLIQELEEANEKLQAENYFLKEEIKLDHDFDHIITKSNVFKKVLKKVEKVASTNSTVLIRGESGTGKELLARAVHNLSSRASQPLIKVNCAAFPSELIESELFGHEKGAFTGAQNPRRGRFELADKGTIFLDELGEMPLDLQAKLLRVLQEGEFERLGSEKTMKVDVRVIAATNRNLEEAITNKEFREDLYYRLNVFPIQIPPLRERKEDIPYLVKFFLKKYEGIIGKSINKVPSRVIDQLTQYNWPGNIRELENVIERSMIISGEDKLDLGESLVNQTGLIDRSILPLEAMEREHILMVLEKTNWKVSGKNGAAEILQINPKTLFSRMEKLAIRKPENF